ncbi:tripartite tricarboxylate transporter TctB family protein [Microbacterium candidum]|uniref:Tripartite tricarboxylate transporter TctB family protein n=1 Tax=Microbacterium candidum TaxID=3041922 RepID=A0ABT7MXD0_9MICO|nr:tripartite tricarboxylate transporter TctB family protein [Microbacterium sp. ASV49]MDL9979094.1 tripartite tricarboxylate transporter TctB family protein [Microbacterium sp. ASV49]
MPSSSEEGTAPGDGGAAGTAAAHPRRRGELIFALVVLVVGVVTLVGVFTTRVPAGARVGPTVFPAFVSVLLLAAGAVILVGVLRGRYGTPDESEDLDPNAKTDWMTLAKIVGLVVAFLLLLTPIGWTPAATLLFGGVAWTLGTRRWWLGFLVGFVLALVVQVVFGELLGLSLPAGPLFGWISALI